MLKWYRNEKIPATTALNQEKTLNLIFYIKGAIFYVNENGSCEEVLSSGSPIKNLLYNPTKEILVVMTDASIMGIFHAEASGALTEQNKVKMKH